VLTPDRAAGRRAALLELYRIAIDEYRFEVQLGWERTSHLLTLDSGLFAASVGLVQLGYGSAGTWHVALVSIVSLVGAGIAGLGLFTVVTCRGYYERTKVKKAFFEKRLGLLRPHPGQTSADSSLAVTTTDGMADVEAMLADPDAWLRGRRFRWFRRAVTTYTGWLFVLLAAVHAALALVVLIGLPRPIAPSG